MLTGLRPKVKMLFAAGRFLDDADGAAAFALPNATHVTRCEPLKADVEAALAAEFGRPVPLVLVVDGGADAPEPPPVTDDAAAGRRRAVEPAPAPRSEMAEAWPTSAPSRTWRTRATRRPASTR